MTREIKIGMAVAGSFLSLVGIVVGTKLYNGEMPEPTITGNFAEGNTGPKESDPQKKPSSDLSPKVIQANAVEGAKPLFGSGPSDPLSLPAVPNGNAFSPLPAPLEPNASGLPAVPLAPLPPVNAANESQTDMLAKLSNAAKGLGNSGTNVNDDRRPMDLFAGLPIPTQPSDANPGTTPPVAGKNASINTGVRTQGSPSDLPQLPTQQTGTPGIPQAGPCAPRTLINNGTPPPQPGFPELKPNKDSNPLPPNVGKDASPPNANGSPIPRETLPPGGAGQLPIVSPIPPNSSLPQFNDPTKPAITTPSSPIIPAPKTEPTAPLQPPFNPQPSGPINTNLTAGPQPFNPSGPTNTIQSPFNNAVPPANNNAAPVPPFNLTQPVPISPAPSNGIPLPPDPFAPQSPPNGNPFQTPTQSGPIVKTGNWKQFPCTGNETFDQIARQEYPSARVNLGPALEEFNRNLPGAPLALRQRPAQIQPGMKIMVPPQDDLLDLQARSAPGAIQSIPAITPVNNNRPIGSELGLNPPAPGNKLPAAAAPTASYTNYIVPSDNMYLSKVAELQLGSAFRWIDIYRLNPTLQPEQPLRKGLEIKVPLK